MSTPPPETNLNMRTSNAESQKRSAKGSNFKEDDGALPLCGCYYSLNQDIFPLYSVQCAVGGNIVD